VDKFNPFRFSRPRVKRCEDIPGQLAMPLDAPAPAPGVVRELSANTERADRIKQAAADFIRKARNRKGLD